MPAADGRPITIRPATGPDDIAHAHRLFETYAAALGVDLCFQNFADELAGLPGAYAPPSGALLLAMDGGVPIGCVAMRPLDITAHDAEMKRLYVSPGARGAGVGRRLVEALVDRARGQGYRDLYLDTLPEMGVAQRLYRALGFEETSAYVHNPVPGSKFFRLTLL